MILTVNWSENVSLFLSNVIRCVRIILLVIERVSISFLVPKCSHWNVETFTFYSSQLKVLYLNDFILSEEREVDISSSTAIYIPQLFYPTRSMVEWCYLYSSTDIYSIFFTDAVNSSFTALYHVKCVFLSIP